jgi:IS30 family transposase
MKYLHFSIEEREKIQGLLWQKASVRAIAMALNRSPSSVSREINRNVPLKRSYRPRLANERAVRKRSSRGRKLRLKNNLVRHYAVTKLKEGWSPEQIAGRLHLDHPQESISHEAIYQYIYSHIHRNGWGEVKKHYQDLRPYLKRRHKRRGQHGMRGVQRVCKPKGRSIEDRPKSVETRKQLGHWEGDSIESLAHRPGLNTLVERKSGLVFISKLSARTAVVTSDAVITRLSTLPPKLRRTLTVDNGSENQDWERLERELDLDCYHAHPYCSGERGTNENTNGLIRWYYPKRTDFATISETEIRAVEEALNNRPRKRLGWRTPLEVFNASVALQS